MSNVTSESVCELLSLLTGKSPWSFVHSHREGDKTLSLYAVPAEEVTFQGMTGRHYDHMATVEDDKELRVVDCGKTIHTVDKENLNGEGI